MHAFIHSFIHSECSDTDWLHTVLSAGACSMLRSEMHLSVLTMKGSMMSPVPGDPLKKTHAWGCNTEHAFNYGLHLEGGLGLRVEGLGFKRCRPHLEGGPVWLLHQPLLAGSLACFGFRHELLLCSCRGSRLGHRTKPGDQHLQQQLVRDHTPHLRRGPP